MSESDGLSKAQLSEILRDKPVAPDWTEHGVNLRSVSSFSQLNSIANVNVRNTTLDSLPLTATDILYNLGFASSESASQIPSRFVNNGTNVNLGKGERESERERERERESERDR
eukprot:sb/3476882/